MKTTLMNSQLSYNFLPTQTNITHKSSSFTHTTMTTSTRAFNPLSLRNSSTNVNVTKVEYNALKSYQSIQETTVINSSESDDSSPPAEQVEGNANDLGRSLVITGAVSLGFLVIMGLGHDKAWALGPEGPLLEEFWENVRRYALYALTVSTGVIYSVVQPIYELLRNPISAILVLIILGGTFYIGSQVLYAMVGISDFSYQYAY